MIPYIYIKHLNERNLLDLCEKMGVHKKSTIIAVTAELGLYPLLIDLLTYSAKYWLYLCNTGIDSIAKNRILTHKSQVTNFKPEQHYLENIGYISPYQKFGKNHDTLYRH